MSAKAMLCRCEDVTLDEVMEAIEAGHHDIESVKRYTGFGTGWCQGKQCVVACARAGEGDGQGAGAAHHAEASAAPGGARGARVARRSGGRVAWRGWW